jgi:hypothetical protein
MNENELRLLLNQGTPVRPEIAERLRHARELALERHQPEAAPALAAAGGVVGGLGGWSGIALRVLLPLALLVAAGAILYNWQQNQRAAELEEIDSQLLTDDLPIDAYLDRGFQNWLRKQRGDGE